MRNTLPITDTYSDPTQTLRLNPFAAVLEAYSLLEQDLLVLAISNGFNADQSSALHSALEFLISSGIIHQSAMAAVKSLQSARNEAVHSPKGVDTKAAERYLELIETVRQKLPKPTFGKRAA